VLPLLLWYVSNSSIKSKQPHNYDLCVCASFYIAINTSCSRYSRCWIALYMYKEDLLWVWNVLGVLIISTHWESTFCTNIHSSSPNSRYKAGSVSLWPPAMVEGAETLYIYIYIYIYKEDLLWVWNVNVLGVLIISTHWESTSYANNNKIHYQSQYQEPENRYQANH
jgi:hypothetical protein